MAGGEGMDPLLIELIKEITCLAWALKWWGYAFAVLFPIGLIIKLIEGIISACKVK